MIIIFCSDILVVCVKFWIFFFSELFYHIYFVHPVYSQVYWSEKISLLVKLETFEGEFVGRWLNPAVYWLSDDLSQLDSSCLNRIWRFKVSFVTALSLLSLCVLIGQSGSDSWISAESTDWPLAIGWFTCWFLRHVDTEGGGSCEHLGTKRRRRVWSGGTEAWEGQFTERREEGEAGDQVM